MGACPGANCRARSHTRTRTRKISQTCARSSTLKGAALAGGARQITVSLFYLLGFFPLSGLAGDSFGVDCLAFAGMFGEDEGTRWPTSSALVGGCPDLVMANAFLMNARRCGAKASQQAAFL